MRGHSTVSPPPRHFTSNVSPLDIYFLKKQIFVHSFVLLNSTFERSMHVTMRERKINPSEAAQMRSDGTLWSIWCMQQRWCHLCVQTSDMRICCIPQIKWMPEQSEAKNFWGIYTRGENTPCSTSLHTCALAYISCRYFEVRCLQPRGHCPYNEYIHVCYQ